MTRLESRLLRTVNAKHRVLFTRERTSETCPDAGGGGRNWTIFALHTFAFPRKVDLALVHEREEVVCEQLFASRYE